MHIYKISTLAFLLSFGCMKGMEKIIPEIRDVQEQKTRCLEIKTEYNAYKKPIDNDEKIRNLIYTNTHGLPPVDYWRKALQNSVIVKGYITKTLEAKNSASEAWHSWFQNRKYQCSYLDNMIRSQLYPIVNAPLGDISENVYSQIGTIVIQLENVIEKNEAQGVQENLFKLMRWHFKYVTEYNPLNDHSTIDALLCWEPTERQKAHYRGLNSFVREKELLLNNEIKTLEYENATFLFPSFPILLRNPITQDVEKTLIHIPISEHRDKQKEVLKKHKIQLQRTLRNNRPTPKYDPSTDFMITELP